LRCILFHDESLVCCHPGTGARGAAEPSAGIAIKAGRDANQPIDEEYTKKIREYTTERHVDSGELFMCAP